MQISIFFTIVLSHEYTYIDLHSIFIRSHQSCVQKSGCIHHTYTKFKSVWFTPSQILFRVATTNQNRSTLLWYVAQPPNSAVPPLSHTFFGIIHNWQVSGCIYRAATIYTSNALLCHTEKIMNNENHFLRAHGRWW